MDRNGPPPAARPGSPAMHLETGQHAVPAVPKRAYSAKRRQGDDRRRRQSLRRVKNSQEELRRTRTRGQSNSSVPDNQSPSAGRSFTVGNVHNGLIYLRPVVRPAAQRSRPQPDPFVFPPQTPPDSLHLDLQQGFQSNSGSRTPTARDEAPPPIPRDVNFDNTQHARTPSKPIQHVRSRSFSTADDHTASLNADPHGTFKIVIERPSTRRPKTADTGSLPVLQVPIPHYRLGTPRFSARGTAILRSSVYTKASGEEYHPHSSMFSNTTRVDDNPFPSFISRRHSEAFPPTPVPHRTTMAKDPLQPATAPSSARVSKVPIGPQIYDALTLNPDDNAVVRFSPTGDILAATPSRLIAHITSPSFLDYELLSDFFLTFRSFLSARDLVAYLLARLRWAVNRQDDFGRIVRVRTFVALRHWILNYFVDDFVPNYQLRVYFCNLVNSLHEDLRIREDGGGGDIKIIGELKKCWRRTCALYWEETELVGRDMPDDDLLPGGRIGSREFRDTAPPVTPPRQTARSKAKTDTFSSNPSDQFASKHMEWVKSPRHLPQQSLTSPHVSSQDYDGMPVPLSPESEISMQVLSCSIPMRGLTRADPGTDLPLYPHPVPAHATTSPQYSVSINRANRPSHAHKRSGSFSDALRDHRAPLPLSKISSQDARVSSGLKVPGSLVRGAIFQPSSPYIDVKTIATLHSAKSHAELEPVDVGGQYGTPKPGYAQSPGMKKILGSVRRALSTKPGNLPHATSSGSFEQQPSASSARISDPNLIHNTASSGGVHKRRYARSRTQGRYDALAAKVSESFNAAIKAELELEKQGSNSAAGTGGWDFAINKPRSQLSEDRLGPPGAKHTRLNSNVTMGSRSIVIFDDTSVPMVPMMSGALPVERAVSQSASGSPTANRHDAPRPENVPEERVEMTRHSELYDDPPPLAGLGLRYQTPQDVARPPSSIKSLPKRSLSSHRPVTHRPSSALRRQASMKSARSASTSLRRYTSYSGLNKHQANPSLGASSIQSMSSDNDPFVLDRQPARQLRRRPGGNLRQAGTVHDLELEPIQRPHSTGTLSNRTHSIANSVIHTSGLATKPVDPSERNKGLGNPVVPESATPKKRLSLVETHSSQPNLRPSFEAEVAKLAALPDDTDDDGGVESALLKLEGKYEKKSPDPSPRTTGVPETYRPTGAPEFNNSQQSITQSSDTARALSSNAETVDGSINRRAPAPAPSIEGTSVYRLSGEDFAPRRTGPESSIAESEDSFSSIPLLERGLSDKAVSKPYRSHQDRMRDSAKPAPLKTSSPSRTRTQATRQYGSPDSSMEFVVETDSMKRIPKGSTIPRSPNPRESFLLNEDEDLSDMSDNDATPRSDDSQGVRSFFDDEPAVLENDNDILRHPMRHPPTPPLTADRFQKPMPSVDTTVFQRGLPTPGLTPTTRLNTLPFSQATQQTEAIELKDLSKDTDPAQPPSHLPFILAYDSETLAQQFTVIEKDALDEIDWKELIELRWKQSSPQIHNWVDYLRTEEPRGVDIVIARFNLMVKWALSECVLTENMEERARCIVKYIHIASHARRFRNYATMYQITIALLSTDCARLKRTWELVPAAEMQTMRDLEALVQPLRNFHNLRVEMETASLEEGCIPFIGIYTRDLIYNAQKPAFIGDGPVGGERLVNFERHHTAASIVKSLLRLLEASSKYTFTPEPAIVSRCLWMAALSDEEISVWSRKWE
ncbi:hypothetical protein BU16DRAFT_510375 [Lophium mytilinum]|uniref:Ras GEF n=1 Tax=Lophium mytilinum TaxID=390894 RepID=A0A6A6QSY7_9PEZI|nr:hypothetical protein BU16DRAFT_510375 [Lophium mytilinum]